MKVKSVLCCFLCLIFCCFVSAFAEEQKSAKLRIGGGTAPLTNVFKPLAQPFKASSGIDLELVECDIAQAWDGLLKGDFDVATAGIRSPFRLRDLPIPPRSALTMPRKGYVWNLLVADAIIILAHPEIASPTSLEPEQVKRLFTGRIVNWKELGGPDMPVTLVIGSKIYGVNAEFRHDMLDDEAFHGRIVWASTGEDVKRTIARTPGAVGIGVYGQAREQDVRVIDYPAVRRQNVMLWNSNSVRHEEIERLRDFMHSDEGKAHMRMELPR